MPDISINSISNANCYINGNSLLGRIEEIQLPQVKLKMVDKKALGMYGAFKLPAGIDVLEGKIKWTSFYSDTFQQYANATQTVQLQVRASIEQWDSTGLAIQTPMVAFMTVIFHEFPLGTFKHQEPAEFETSITVYYIKITAGGVDQLEYDALANIYKIGGVDMLAQYTSNIGG